MLLCSWGSRCNDRHRIRPMGVAISWTVAHRLSSRYLLIRHFFLFNKDFSCIKNIEQSNQSQLSIERRMGPDYPSTSTKIARWLEIVLIKLNPDRIGFSFIPSIPVRWFDVGGTGNVSSNGQQVATPSESQRVPNLNPFHVESLDRVPNSKRARMCGQKMVLRHRKTGVG